MQHITVITPFASTATPAGTLWIGMDACGGALGSLALVWREER